MAKSSSPVPAEAEFDVKDRELAQITDIDLSSINPDYVYRWVHKSQRKISRKRAVGWEIVVPADEPDIRNTLGDPLEEDADGTYTLGDVVLMRIRKVQHRARRHAVKRHTDQRLRGPERKFKREARDRGAERGLSIEVITDKDVTED